MNTFKRKDGEPHSRAVTDGHAQRGTPLQLVDNRPASISQRALAEGLNQRASVQSQLRLQQMLNESPRVATQMKLAEVLSGRQSAVQTKQAMQRQDALEDEGGEINLSGLNISGNVTLPVQSKWESAPTEGHIILRKESSFRLRPDAGQSLMAHQSGAVVQRALSVNDETYTPQEAWENLAEYNLDISESGALRVLREWADDDDEYDDWDGLAEDLEASGYNEEIEGEMVYIKLEGNNEEEQMEQAADIIMAITLTYGINLDSSVTRDAINKSLDLNRAEIGERVYKSRRKKLEGIETDSWALEDLEALLRALSRFGNILGSKRASSPRANVPQEITTFGKFTKAVDFEETLAETFSESGHIALYEEGTTESNDEPDKEDKIQTLIHELTHGLLEHRLKDFENSISYWRWIKNEERKERRDESYVRGEFEGEEKPPNAVAEQSAAEDMAESTAMYLYSKKSKEKLRDEYPERYYIVGKIIKEEMGT